MSLLVILLLLVASNFLYQAFGNRNWDTALERSYFQAVALWLVWMLN